MISSGPRRFAVLVWASFALFLLALPCSCARRGMPPGGPVDSVPPLVVSTTPDSGRVSVGLSPQICIAFSEPMDKRTVRDAILLRPARRLADTNWRKNVFCMSLADSLRPATTYSVSLMSGCKDSHGNAMKEPYAFTFSTGDSIAPGLISGVVKVKTLPAPWTPVWAYDSVRTPLPDFTNDEPDYVAQAGPNGEYKFVGLPLGTYLVYGFKDKDADKAFDEGTDFASPAAGPARLTASEPAVAGLEIALVDPKEPGGVRGVVLHCFPPDSVVIAVTAASLSDSTAEFSTSAGRDSTFAIGDMPAGRYTVSCFADLNRNGVRDGDGEVECLEPHVVQVIPGDVVTGVKLELPCPEPAADVKKGD